MPHLDEHRDVGDQQTYLIIGAAMAVHRNLGPGFLEVVYQKALGIEFRERGISHERELEIPVYYRGSPLGIGFRADFVCFGEILVELKGLSRLTQADEAQALTRAILLNFGGPSFR